MAYIPTQWQDGDLITAERMNHIERGVANEQVGPQGPQGEPGKDEGPRVSRGKMVRLVLLGRMVRKGLPALPVRRSPRPLSQSRSPVGVTVSRQYPFLEWLRMKPHNSLSQSQQGTAKTRTTASACSAWGRETAH